MVDNVMTVQASTSYAGSYIYKDNLMEMIFQPEGYLEPNGNGGFKYAFQYKDHLGNIRLTYADSDGDGSIDPSNEIIEENHYYPFGLKHKGYNYVVQNSNSTASKFKYNGKEISEELGLTWYDYGARNYDPAIGRWMNSDPLAEQMRRHNPYNYAFNNPMYFIDPDGMAPASFGWGHISLSSEDKTGKGQEEKDRKSREEAKASREEHSRNDKKSEINIEELYENAAENTFTIYNFSELDDMKLIVDAYNALMNIQMYNTAVQEVFSQSKNYRELYEKWHIEGVVILDYVNKNIRDPLSYNWNTVQFDSDFNVTGIGSKDYIVNYAYNTPSIRGFNVGSKTQEMGQSTFLSGWYPIYFEFNPASSWGSINFIGFRTIQLRNEYLQYWKNRKNEYAKILKTVE